MAVEASERGHRHRLARRIRLVVPGLLAAQRKLPGLMCGCCPPSCDCYEPLVFGHDPQCPVTPESHVQVPEAPSGGGWLRAAWTRHETSAESGSPAAAPQSLTRADYLRSLSHWL